MPKENHSLQQEACCDSTKAKPVSSMYANKMEAVCPSSTHPSSTASSQAASSVSVSRVKATARQFWKTLQTRAPLTTQESSILHASVLSRPPDVLESTDSRDDDFVDKKPNNSTTAHHYALPISANWNERELSKSEYAHDNSHLTAYSSQTLKMPPSSSGGDRYHTNHASSLPRDDMERKNGTAATVRLNRDKVCLRFRDFCVLSFPLSPSLPTLSLPKET